MLLFNFYPICNILENNYLFEICWGFVSVLIKFKEKIWGIDFLWGGYLKNNVCQKQISFDIFPGGLIWFWIFIVGGGPLPQVFCTNLLVGVKLGYMLNFTALGHLEVP